MKVQRSVEEIYEYAANLENLPEWAGAVSETRKRTPEPLLESTPFSPIITISTPI